jgi:hypothetical protein
LVGPVEADKVNFCLWCLLKPISHDPAIIWKILKLALKVPDTGHKMVKKHVDAKHTQKPLNRTRQINLCLQTFPEIILIRFLFIWGFESCEFQKSKHFKKSENS